MQIVRALSFVFLSFSIKLTLACFQVGDFLIYKGDTIEIFTQPLEELYDSTNRPDSVFFHDSRCYSTDCWRGYVALWLLQDSQLYLIEVTDCCGMDNSGNGYPAGKKLNLEHIVPKQYFKNGRVEASWVSFCLYNPIGDPVYIRNQGYNALYKEERLFCFENGKLVNTEYYNNSGTKYNTLYAANNDSLAEFIYNRINWDSVPEIKRDSVMSMVIMSDSEGKITYAGLWLASKDEINSATREVSRVILLLPEWDTYYRLGEHQKKIYWIRRIIFTEGLRKKYISK